MGKYTENKPTADILMASMRAMGYTFESAIADILDNSISAKAKIIQINFPIDPKDSFIAICDDGCGMTKEELFDAMTYGSCLKRDSRSDDDLGRFGLGLKSASLSQCRKLTVVSKKNGVLSSYIWDLDVVIKKREWIMIECSSDDINDNKYISFLNDKDSGTVVIWENFDIFKDSNKGEYAELMDKKIEIIDCLRLIFHRFLNKKKITIKINNCSLTGLDPFLENHPKTTIHRCFSLNIPDNDGIEREVKVQPFVLPFYKDLTDNDKKLSGGFENYRTQQGFYIYRNERLIVWGNWFGRPRDELTKYARIRVDIPNTLDSIWKIDIKKQAATIPSSIRKRLNRAVDEAMESAVKKQKFRGRIEKVDEHINYVWNRIKGRESIYTYKINRESQIFELIKNKIDDSTWTLLEMVLEEIESNIPFQQIYIDKSQNQIDETIDEVKIGEIEEKARILIDNAIKKGISKKDIIDSIILSEPFCKYELLVEKLKSEVEK